MNQILDYDNSRNNGNPIKPSGDGTDKIVRIFAILIMVFAVALVGVVGYGMFFSNNKENNTEQISSKANVDVNVDGDQAIIEVTHDKVIKEIIYSWNSSSDRTIQCKEKYVKQEIDVPAGNNTLYIKVIDEDGGETEYSEEISSEEGVDILNPVIELSVTDDKKLKITAKDETALDFITIRWNDDDEETVYADEDSKEISTEIEILKGENDLTVIAVDTSNNTTKESKSFKGLTKPEIKVELVDDGSKINIKAQHEKGIKSVKFNFNNVDYNVDIGNENPKEIEFEQPLETGYNRIILTVNSVDDTETVFDGECTYGDASSNTRREVSSDSEDEEEQDSDRDNNDNSEDNN